MNSAARPRHSGRKIINKREKPIDGNLIDFLEKRGLYQRGRQPLNRSLWHNHYMEAVTTRNGCGNHAKIPVRHFGELIIHSHPPKHRAKQAA